MEYISKFGVMLAFFFTLFTSCIFGVENECNKNTNPDECIVVCTPTADEVEDKGYKLWPVWAGSKKSYPTKTYSSTELCYFIEGEVKVITDAGKEYQIKPGDLVIFKKGCTCTWYLSKPVKKHYKFE